MRKNAPWLRLYTWVIIVWLSLPILVMILFGFNDTTGKFNFVWQGWTLRWYRELFDINDLTHGAAQLDHDRDHRHARSRPCWAR